MSFSSQPALLQDKQPFLIRLMLQFPQHLHTDGLVGPCPFLIHFQHAKAIPAADLITTTGGLLPIVPISSVLEN